MFSRRLFLQHVSCCIAVLVLGSVFGADAQEHDRPNILFIMSDDHANKAISTYGNSHIETPHLALEYLENRPKDNPFCLLLHHKAPHDYWEYDIELKSLFENDTIPEPETMLKEYPNQEVLKQVICKMGMEDCSFEDSDFHEQIGEVLPLLRNLKSQNERFQFAYQFISSPTCAAFDPLITVLAGCWTIWIETIWQKIPW